MDELYNKAEKELKVFREMVSGGRGREGRSTNHCVCVLNKDVNVHTGMILCLLISAWNKGLQFVL